MKKIAKILIIEDDVNLFSGLQAKFRIEGFEALADEGVDEFAVLRKIVHLMPNYIILDIILAKINGLDLLKKIKAISAISRIPIIIFTNLGDKDSRQQAGRLGVNSYLLKTEFNLDEFIDKFKKIIINQEKIK